MGEADPLSISAAQFTSQFGSSAIYMYNPENKLVRVTPTPFGAGSEVEGYFAIKNPAYVGR